MFNFTVTVAKILNKFNLLDYLNLICPVNIGQTKIKIPIINKFGYSLLSFSSQETWLTNIIKIALQSNKGVFIDVGVNIGRTLLKLKSIDQNIEYIGFEPNSFCTSYVNKLITINNIDNCQVIPVGLSNQNTVLSLSFNDDLDTSASIVPNFRNKSFHLFSTYVPVFTGDYLLKNLGINSISFIKIDVEGAELEVIQGFQESIVKYHPIIYCEVLPVYDLSTPLRKSRRQKQIALEKIIKKCGYKIYRIMHSGKVIAVNTFGVHSDLSLCEYIFISETDADNFFKILK